HVIATGSPFASVAPRSAVRGASAVASESRRHRLRAGLASTLPAASTARTAKAWRPSLILRTVTGDVHGANLPPSIEQVNVTLGSEAWKRNVAALAPVTAPRVPP